MSSITPLSKLKIYKKEKKYGTIEHIVHVSNRINAAKLSYFNDCMGIDVLPPLHVHVGEVGASPAPFFQDVMDGMYYC